MTDFEWDPAKAAANLRKHGVDFADAATTFEDSGAVTVRDPDAIRIISARPASRVERALYRETL